MTEIERLKADLARVKAEQARNQAEAQIKVQHLKRAAK